MLDSNGGVGGGKQTPVPESASMRMAVQAEVLSGALGMILVQIDGTHPEVRAKLLELRRAFDEHAMRARDVASGASARRTMPMAQAWRKARQDGGASWSSAFAELAQAALGEARPAWYAASALAALAPDWSQVDASAARALVVPIERERSLGAPGYVWEWLSTDSILVREAWSLALEHAGVAGGPSRV